MKEGAVIPGTQLIEVFIGQPGTVGEKLLRFMHKPLRHEPIRYPRAFGERGTITEGYLTVGEEQRPLRLVLGSLNDARQIVVQNPEKAGRVLYFDPSLGTVSTLKANLQGHVWVLQVGSSLSDERLDMLATQSLGHFVVHGNGWEDRARKKFLQPYGLDPSPLTRSGRRQLARLKTRSASA